MPLYDTWTWLYEHDGVNQELVQVAYTATGETDEATNGIDDGATPAFGVDDLSERETSPPYVVPLAGIRITLRVVELDSREVRQTAVVSKFSPE